MAVSLFTLKTLPLPVFMKPSWRGLASFSGALRLGSDIFKTMPLLTKIIMANWDVQVMLRTLPFGRALRFLPVLFGKPLQNRRKDIDPLNA